MLSMSVFGLQMRAVHVLAGPGYKKNCRMALTDMDVLLNFLSSDMKIFFGIIL